MDDRIWTYWVCSRDQSPLGGWETEGGSKNQEVDPGSLGKVFWDNYVVWVPLLVLQVEDSRVTEIQVQILRTDSPADERITW